MPKSLPGSAEELNRFTINVLTWSSKTNSTSYDCFSDGCGKCNPAQRIPVYLTDSAADVRLQGSTID
jgi:hypothetical protein